MKIQEIGLLILLAVIAFLLLRRWLLVRSVRHYSPHQLGDRLRQSPAPLLLDVRTASERRERHIDGSLHIPVNEFPRRLGELEKHRGREIICYCQTGSRSLVAAARLKKSGHVAANLKGGMVEWNSVDLR